MAGRGAGSRRRSRSRASQEGAGRRAMPPWEIDDRNEPVPLQAGELIGPGRVMTAPAARRRYRRLQILLPVVLIGYVAVAWADWWLPHRASSEIFPFFSWDLFSSPRIEGRLYTVRITAVRGPQAPAAGLLHQTLEDPKSIGFLRDPRFQKTARDLARAHWHKQSERRDKLAAQLGNFLHPLGVVEYDLLMLKYHPLRYYHGEEPTVPEFISRFDLRS